MPFRRLKHATAILGTLVIAACGGEDTSRRIEDLGDAGERALDGLEQDYGSGSELLQEAPDTEVFVDFDGYSDATFDKVYRYQANVADTATFIWMTFDNNDMDEQHIAVTLDLAAISGEGEYTLDRQRNGNIYVEMDGLAFRSDTGDATVNITSATGAYLEGSFTAQNIGRSQNQGSETLTIEEARFKLPLNDMRRQR